ncbi:MAG: hypothetical protein AAGF12_27435, partial [Myxococcota bacterium]
MKVRYDLLSVSPPARVHRPGPSRLRGAIPLLAAGLALGLTLGACTGTFGETGDEGPVAPGMDPVRTPETGENLVCGLPPADQPRRLNIGELNMIALDVLNVQNSPFDAIGNDYGETVGAYLSTGERFVSSYFDTAHEVAELHVTEANLGA